MENARAFFDYVRDYMIEEIKKGETYKVKEELYPSLGNVDYYRLTEYVEKVANKLFSMCKEDRPIYAKLMIECINIYYGICYDSVEMVTTDVINKKTGKSRKEKEYVYIYEFKGEKFDMSAAMSDIDDFVEAVFGLFLDFGVDVYSIIKKIEEKAARSDCYDELEDILAFAANGPVFNLNKGIRKKLPRAKTTEQVDVIRTFIKSAGVKYKDDTALAEFISWLCGGTEDSVRKNGIVPNTGYGNEKELKKQFANIGIDYDKGTIKH